MFKNLKTIQTKIFQTADRTVQEATGQGDIRIKVQVDNIDRDILLKEVLYTSMLI